MRRWRWRCEASPTRRRDLRGVRQAVCTKQAGGLLPAEGAEYGENLGITIIVTRREPDHFVVTLLAIRIRLGSTCLGMSAFARRRCWAARRWGLRCNRRRGMRRVAASRETLMGLRKQPAVDCEDRETPADEFLAVTDERPVSGTKCPRTQSPPAHLRPRPCPPRAGSLVTPPEPSKPRRRWHSQRRAASLAIGFR